jgi:hypothetical protein
MSAGASAFWSRESSLQREWAMSEMRSSTGLRYLRSSNVGLPDDAAVPEQSFIAKRREEVFGKF